MGRGNKILNTIAARQSERVLAAMIMLHSLMLSNIQKRQTSELLIVLLKMLAQ
jgi:hypothetical protein